MIATLQAALVIARRDYVATVWSRTFILFLIGPLFPIIFGTLFGAIGSKMNHTPAIPTIAVIATPGQGQNILQSRDRIAGALGESVIPRVKIVAPAGNLAHQRKALLDHADIAAVLTGLPDHPLLAGSSAALGTHGEAVKLIMQDASRISAAVKDLDLARLPIDHAAKPAAIDRTNVARGGQLVLLILTMILAGMLLSNLIEEKSSKVIEILAAAVPVDAIFLGKLIAMLGMSLTGITVWAAVSVGGIAMLAPGLLTGLTVPAIGWPVFILLGIIYFIASYLLLGSLFLGIGSQAATVREVQTLSMPITMGQLIIFALASAAVENPDGVLGRLAIAVPWSSPFAMLARAAEQPQIWPHLVAIVWQIVWVGLIIRIGARLFRRSVLKSGSGISLWRRLRGR